MAVNLALVPPSRLREGSRGDEKAAATTIALCGVPGTSVHRVLDFWVLRHKWLSLHLSPSQSEPMAAWTGTTQATSKG